MLNTVSVVVGIVALIGAAVGFLPFLGWLNWLVIPLGVLGFAVGLLARNRRGAQPQPAGADRGLGTPDDRRRALLAVGPIPGRPGRRGREGVALVA